MTDLGERARAAAQAHLERQLGAVLRYGQLVDAQRAALRMNAPELLARFQEEAEALVVQLRAGGGALQTLEVELLRPGCAWPNGTAIAELLAGFRAEAARAAGRAAELADELSRHRDAAGQALRALEATPYAGREGPPATLLDRRG